MAERSSAKHNFIEHDFHKIPNMYPYLTAIQRRSATVSTEQN